MSPEATFWFIVFFCSFWAVFFIGSSIVLLWAWREDKKKAEKVNKTLGITEKPIVPDWLKARKERRTVFTGKKCVRFECRDFKKQYSVDKKTKEQVEKSQCAIWWLQRLIYKGTTGKVDRTTCLASVPLENFKCGQTPNEFSPISGSAPGSFLTYQMFGDNKIQVTYYVEDGKTYPAGYCVYIEDPYAKEADYPEKVIKEISKGLKYDVDLKFKREYEDQVLQKIEERKQEGLNKFTVKICKSTRKMVVIGLEHGVVKHYEWYDCYDDYVHFDCKTCQLEGNADAPPSYELLSEKD